MCDGADSVRVITVQGVTQRVEDMVSDFGTAELVGEVVPEAAMGGSKSVSSRAKAPIG